MKEQHDTTIIPAFKLSSWLGFFVAQMAEPSESELRPFEDIQSSNLLLFHLDFRASSPSSSPSLSREHCEIFRVCWGKTPAKRTKHVKHAAESECVEILCQPSSPPLLKFLQDVHHGGVSAFS